eukprot:9846963-Alexandrium_andersonii.AAC.1
MLCCLRLGACVYPQPLRRQQRCIGQRSTGTGQRPKAATARREQQQAHGRRVMQRRHCLLYTSPSPRD